MRVVVVVNGMDELKRRVQDEVTRPVTDAVAGDASRMVPVISGDLQGTIRPEVADWNIGRVWCGDIDAGIDYHLYVEEGTSRMAAQPYMRPALYRTRSL